MVRKSLFSRMRKRSIINPCGLLSDRTVFCRSHSVMSETLRNVALADDHLPRVGDYMIWISFEIATHAIHCDGLRYVGRDDAVVVSLLVPVFVVTVGTLVREEERPVDVRLDSGLVRGHREEQFMEAAHMLAGFYGTVLCRILRKGKHERFALIEYVDLLPLGFREAVGCPHCRHRDQRAGSQKEHAEEPQVAKGRFYILQCFEFHILLRFIVSSKPLLYGLRHFRSPLRRLRQRPIATARPAPATLSP